MLQASPIYQRLAALAVSEIPDAALFEIDLSGSSVTYPSTGNVTLTLYDSAGGVAVAARQFSWYRSGTVLRLTDPDSANAWAAAEGGSANELRYALATVSANANPGEQIISVASRYEGATTASASSTFTVCTKDPSPYQCSMQ